MNSRIFLIALLALGLCAQAAAATVYRPFVLASVSEKGLEMQIEETVAALQDAGFSVAGQYRPLETAAVIVATSDELKSLATASERGAYAVALRVSVAERNGQTEVAYVNPLYLQHAYRLETGLQGVMDRLATALGAQDTYGSEKGLTEKKLRKYNYMIGMQKFDDPSELGTFSSFGEAVAAVENGLAREGDALSQVYRIDLPDTQQVLFGVAMKASGEEDQPIDESFQMSVVDFEGHAKVAYFPYEVLVNGNQVEALHMRFRMAVHFPDLPMMGAHGFTKLMSSPGATEDALEALVESP